MLARRSKQRTWWTDYKDIQRPGNVIARESRGHLTMRLIPGPAPGP